MWELNDGQVETIIEGIYSRTDVVFVEVKATSPAKQWTKGHLESLKPLTNSVDLTHQNNRGENLLIGEVTIGLTLKNAKNKVLAQFWTLIFSNFIKTLAISFVMVILFEKLVARHLTAIAQHVSHNSWLCSESNLALQRTITTQPDHLDEIVSAVNLAKSTIQQKYNTLEAEIKYRKTIESELKENATKLLGANKEQAEFTYAISHDLKSPSNTISMLLAEIEIAEGDNFSDDGKEFLDMAKKTARRMQILVDDILQYSNTIDDGSNKKNVDLSRVAVEIIEDLRADIRDSSAEVSIGYLPTIQGIEIQLRMLLQNFLSNAIKFKRENIPPVIEIDSTVDHAEGITIVSIKDNGIGIPLQHRDRVFGLFKRLHTQTNYEGSGIGLALCRRIVINHKGTIQIKANADQGTIFVISLPVSS